ncbi:MAG: hypothetical protein LBJ02_09135 [Bifidobacteriaceae bacterium]|jgi:hypothetical protein|nr:hypothetical protein [Bifidobacteriaceae bacterium]
MSGEFASLPPTFTAKLARVRGVNPRDLYSWRDSGDVKELSRGVFRKASAPHPTYPDLLAAALRAPRAVVCCLSAPAIHDLTDELVPGVQLAVPKGSWAPRIDHPPTRVFHFAPDTFDLGLSTVEAAPGESVRVYDAARTVADLMRLRHRFGEPVAHIALNRYLDSARAQPATVLEYAHKLGGFEATRVAVAVAGAR